jgi:hypothetical protein
MKKFSVEVYLNVLMFLTFGVLGASVFFTLVAGESPMEAAGISPAAGTIGMGLLILALIFVPRIFRKPY